MCGHCSQNFMVSIWLGFLVLRGYLKFNLSPDWCDSVGWVWFDSWSGHVSVLWIPSLVGALVRGGQSLTSMFLSHFFSLPHLSLKINK